MGGRNLHWRLERVTHMIQTLEMILGWCLLGLERGKSLAKSMQSPLLGNRLGVLESKGCIFWLDDSPWASSIHPVPSASRIVYLVFTTAVPGSKCPLFFLIDETEVSGGAGTCTGSHSPEGKGLRCESCSVSPDVLLNNKHPFICLARSIRSVTSTLSYWTEQKQLFTGAADFQARGRKATSRLCCHTKCWWPLQFSICLGDKSAARILGVCWFNPFPSL